MLKTAHAGCGFVVVALLAASAAHAQVEPNPYQVVRPQPTARPAASNQPPAAATPSALAAAHAPLRPLAQAVTLVPGATCLSLATLLERVARWLQRDMIDARVRVRVQGDATRKNGVSFVIEGGAGGRAERSIPDAPEDCDQFHSALALSIALAIDASLGGAGKQMVEIPSDEELVAKPHKPEPPYHRLALGVLGHATAGLLTDTSFAGSARIEVGFVPWLDLRAGALGTQLDGQPLRPAGVEGTFYVSIAAIRLDGCGAQTVGGAVRVLACLGGIAGPLRTRGHGFLPDPGRTESRVWSAAVGGIEAQALLLPWLALAGSVDVVVPFARHRIQAVDSRQQLVGERQLKGPAVLVGAGVVLRIL